MDLAGIAALLGVPAVILTALLPLRDRAELTRLERIDRILRDSDLDDDHRELLIEVRQRLVRRVYASVTGPGYTPLAWALLTVPTICIIVLIFMGVVALVRGEDDAIVVPFAAAAILIVGVAYALTLGPKYRRQYADEILPTRFKADRD